MTNQNDLNVGYQAGQQDSEAWKLPHDIVRRYEIYENACDYQSSRALGDAIQLARAALEARK